MERLITLVNALKSNDEIEREIDEEEEDEEDEEEGIEGIEGVGGGGRGGGAVGLSFIQFLDKFKILLIGFVSDLLLNHSFIK